MNLAGAKAWIGKHRKPLAVAGAGGVVALALVVKKSRGASTATSTTTAAGTSSVPSSYLPGSSSGSGSSSGGSYDSSASDVYNALQGSLESVGTQLSGLADLVTTMPVPASSGSTGASLSDTPVVSPAPATPTPAPTPTYTATPNSLVKIAGNDNIIDSTTGKLVSYSSWQSMGSPAPSSTQTLVKSANNPAIYSVDSSGNKTLLTLSQWQAMGSPKPTTV